MFEDRFLSFDSENIHSIFRIFWTKLFRINTPWNYLIPCRNNCPRKTSRKWAQHQGSRKYYSVPVKFCSKEEHITILHKRVLILKAAPLYVYVLYSSIIFHRTRKKKFSTKEYFFFFCSTIPILIVTYTTRIPWIVKRVSNKIVWISLIITR